MIAITVKFVVQDEHVEEWPNLVAEFTEATRAEEGNLWFDWSRSLDDPNTFVLIEAFTDDGAGPHVNSEHFAKAMGELGRYLVERPKIVSVQAPGDGWSELGEIKM
ncbi:MAG TPA: antibiotic biosynthesis monooxygenase [Propionibacterium sp.]|jgi:quinol monooxygenase YgiN|nr:antibiotic biosynthesis monooxygenase [Propionibacterium sp.]